VHEVVRRIPTDQRHDIADELRTTIADTIEGRDVGDPAAAEREVLTEMGDPTQLAARYGDRPLALIGPELYSRYVRLLVILLTTVLPVVTVAFVALDVLDNKDLGSAIVTIVTVVFTVGPQLIAWPTVIFAIVERSRHRRGVVARAGAWTADDLPDDPPEPDRRGSRPASGRCSTRCWSGSSSGSTSRSPTGSMSPTGAAGGCRCSTRTCGRAGSGRSSSASAGSWCST
jgi:hypothetical protein